MKISYRITFLSAIFLFLDQTSKFFVINNLQGNSYQYLHEFFRFRYVENPGIAFGIEIPFLPIVVSNILLLFILIYLGYKEVKLKTPISQTAFSLIIAGGIGNLIDRLLHGHVIDFIGIWFWPYFNLADLYITLGVLLIILFYGKIKRTKAK